MTKEMISRVYYDHSGSGSMNETMKDAKAIDASFRFNDVKEWFDISDKSKSQVKGAKSFVAKYVLFAIAIYISRYVQSRNLPCL